MGYAFETSQQATTPARSIKEIPDGEYSARDLTDMAEAWLIKNYPGSHVVRELSLSDWGGSKVDIAAITETHIVGVEVKGYGDSATRLGRQVYAYSQAATNMWILTTPKLEASTDKHLTGHGSRWRRLYANDGECVDKTRQRGQRDQREWLDRQSPNILSPCAMCGVLWHSELIELVARNDLTYSQKRPTVACLTDLIIRNLTVNTIHDEMVKLLRNRAWMGGKRVIKAPTTARGGLA